MGDERLKKNIGLRYLNEEGIMMYFTKAGLYFKAPFENGRKT